MARSQEGCSAPFGRRNKHDDLNRLARHVNHYYRHGTGHPGLTRWGGVFVMSFVPISYRVQQFITAMSGSVLIALLAPLAVEGDIGARVALLVTAIVSFTTKKPLPAIAAGIAAAAITRLI